MAEDFRQLSPGERIKRDREDEREFNCRYDRRDYKDLDLARKVWMERSRIAHEREDRLLREIERLREELEEVKNG